jgi:hypothetical protein
VDAVLKAGVKGLNAWLKKSGAGSEPIVMRLFALVGEEAGEDKLGPGSRREKLTTREAEAQANRIMEDKSHPDYGPTGIRSIHGIGRWWIRCRGCWR